MTRSNTFLNSGPRRLPRTVWAQTEAIIAGGLLITLIWLVKGFGDWRLILGQDKELCDELEVIVFTNFIHLHQEVHIHSSLVAFLC